MRLEDFPRPKNDNRRGIHWSASVYHPVGAALDFWIAELQAMNIKWVKLLDDSGGSSLELCKRLLAADIMPVVRLYRFEPNPGRIGGREEDTIRRMVAAGVRYFETNNEPDLPAEWQGGRMPRNWLDIVIDNFISDADKVLALGGLPALPAMGVGSKDNPIALVVQKGRADLFEKGAWVAIHNYTLNHPLDYPYDSVNQEGTPVSQEEYDALGPWAWDGQPRDLINEWRRTDKNPGATLEQDPACFLAFHLMDQIILQTLGHRVPIISTEGGPVMGWRDDRRYPRITPKMHADWVVAINDFMQGGRELHGVRCPPNYFAMCHWLIANYRLGFMAPGWESQSWYTDWWNTQFNLNGELPVVEAVKAMPNTPVDQAYQAVIVGQLTRSDTGEPLSGLPVNLLPGGAVAGGSPPVASTTSNADGEFRFERLAPAAYDLEVPPWGIVRRGVMAAPEPAQMISILLTGGQNSALSGTVLDHTGAASEGIRVILSRRGELVAEARTGRDGLFRFERLPLGTYRLSVPGITVDGIALDGWNSKSLKLTTGKPAGYRYVVTERRLLSEAETAGRGLFYGTVSSATAVPLSGVKVQMSWKGAAPGTQFPTTTTGQAYKPAGYYEFVHTSGNFALQVVQGDWPSDVADDLETARVPGREGKPITYEVNFALKPTGTPARVDGTMPGTRSGQKVLLKGDQGTLETRVAADGSFAFPELAPGTYHLELEGIGVIADGIALEPGGLFKLLFPFRSRLRGRVAAPVDGLVAVLHAPPAWGWTRQVPLAPDGSFAFEGLPPGLYCLEVGAQMIPNLELTGENDLVLAALDPTYGQRSVIVGRVADRAGRPQVDLTVILRREGLVVAETRTDADGNYRFAHLPAGTYALEVAGMGEVAGGIVLDGLREQVRDVLWGPAGPAGTLQGRVLGAEGSPRPGVTVRLLRDGAETARTQSDGTGTFRFTGLAAGTYALAVGEGEPSVTGIHLEEDATVTQNVTLPPTSASLFGHYLLFSPPPSPPAGGAGGDVAASREWLALALAVQYLYRSGASGGFSVEDAARAAQVTVVGDGVPADVEQKLRDAGCRVTRLRGDGEALAAAFEAMLAALGEG